jgi:hypothetical protein
LLKAAAPAYKLLLPIPFAPTIWMTMVTFRVRNSWIKDPTNEERATLSFFY